MAGKGKNPTAVDARNALGPMYGNFSRRKTTTQKNYNGDDFTQFEQSQTEIYNEWITSVLINLFKYKNLPSTVNWRYLEYQLRTRNGVAAIGKNSKDDFVVYNEMSEPTINAYGENISSIGSNNIWEKIRKGVKGKGLQQITHYDTNQGDYAVFLNKLSYIPQVNTDFYVVEHYASQLANIRAVSRQNVFLQKTPILTFAKKGTLSATNIVSEMLSGRNIISVSDKFELDDINAINLGIPLITSELKDEWNNILSEMLTYFGINNVGVDKKERLVVNEANGNNELIKASLSPYLEARKQAIELLNERFGWHAEVDINFESVEAINGLAESGGRNDSALSDYQKQQKDGE